MWEEIIAKVLSIVNANDKMQEAFDYEIERFNGTPAATVTPSENESSYATTSENRRVYAVSIKLFAERSGQIKPQDAEGTLRRLVDSLIDDFDKDYTLSGITVPTGYTMLFIEALPAAWGYVGREQQYRFAEIVLRAHLYVDVTAIS